jgi:hypothetical protein
MGIMFFIFVKKGVPEAWAWIWGCMCNLPLWQLKNIMATRWNLSFPSQWNTG